MTLGKLNNKIAIITGGSRGIGKEVTRKYLDEGAKVVIAARSQEELEKTKKEFGSLDMVEIFPMDVSKPDEAKNLVEFTLSKFGAVDILVNAAGIYGPIGSSEKVDAKKWTQTFEVNVFGTFYMMQHVLSVMIKNRNGKIINFSGGGDGPLPRFSAYSASKVSIVRLTETIAEEVKDYNVCINSIAPGAVNTKFLEEALEAGREKIGDERYQKLIDQKNNGGVPPEKAAEICVFLASADSDGLTGKFLSAVWDGWQSWDKDKIKEIMESDIYTLRRKK